MSPRSISVIFMLPLQSQHPDHCFKKSQAPWAVGSFQNYFKKLVNLFKVTNPFFSYIVSKQNKGNPRMWTHKTGVLCSVKN